ncbi:MAG: glycosyltransferase family 2 protein [Lacunisphaera sp.]|nr:glycosyltransferase family 2 protein [Lacunisphaera sp.]
MTPRYSLVVPLYNEAGNLLPLTAAAVAVLDGLAGGWEIIFVDDGSTDSTAAELATVIARWPQCRALVHPHNLGQNHALLAGLRAARGAILCTMDGDGQNDPRDLPLLLAPVEAGELDLACGWRHDRQDSWLRRRMSRLANAVSRRVLRDHLHDNGCQLRAMRREVAAVLFPFELLQSFIPAIAVAHGFKVGEFKVRHHPRLHGQAKYGLRQLWWRPAVALLRLRRQLPR